MSVILTNQRNFECVCRSIRSHSEPEKATDELFGLRLEAVLNTLRIALR
ncbi:MAG: hypothetical protein QF415_12085 [Candidatus Undinarchaeales archaeon]|jgi:hypothetical protein|nr:hypothetical protein [Candidatus Undinarchaeales archaeon]MDP7493631.1 hypothetical protein [Candidatus Undinarchaeales archaeon]